MPKRYMFYKILDPTDLGFIFEWDYLHPLPIIKSNIIHIGNAPITKENYTTFNDIMTTMVIPTVTSKLKLEENSLDPDNTIVLTDIATYHFDNMLQLLYRVFSGYIYYGDPVIKGSSLCYDIFNQCDRKIGIVITSSGD